MSWVANLKNQGGASGQSKRHRDGLATGAHRWSKLKAQRHNIEEAAPGQDAREPSSCGSTEGRVSVRPHRCHTAHPLPAWWT